MSLKENVLDLKVSAFLSRLVITYQKTELSSPHLPLFVVQIVFPTFQFEFEISSSQGSEEHSSFVPPLPSSLLRVIYRASLTVFVLCGAEIAMSGLGSEKLPIQNPKLQALSTIKLDTMVVGGGSRAQNLLQEDSCQCRNGSFLVLSSQN